jgi:hypothetical protein
MDRCPNKTLTHTIVIYDFGYPNSNMDRCPNIISDPYFFFLTILDIQIWIWTGGATYSNQHDNYLWFWISKFEYGQVHWHTHCPTWFLLVILDIQIWIWIDRKKNFHIWISKFKNGHQWQNKHTTTEKHVMTGRQNGYPNPKLTTTRTTCFGLGWPNPKLTMTKKNSFGFGHD